MANAIYTIYLAIRIAGADNCAQNLATFGGHGWVDQVASVRETQIPPTHV